MYLKKTLDEGPRSSDQWIQAILLVESFRLIPRPLDEGPRPKSGKNASRKIKFAMSSSKIRF